MTQELFPAGIQPTAEDIARELKGMQSAWKWIGHGANAERTEELLKAFEVFVNAQQSE